MTNFLTQSFLIQEVYRFDCVLAWPFLLKRYNQIMDFTGSYKAQIGHLTGENYNQIHIYGLAGSFSKED